MNEISILGEAMVGIAWMILPITILSLILGIVLIISMFKLFRKAGKPGIYSIIPIYNFIVFLQIIKLPLINILLMLIPIIGPFIFMFKYSKKTAEAFGESSAYALGIFFLSPIFIPLLAFSDKPYVYSNNVMKVMIVILIQVI